VPRHRDTNTLHKQKKELGRCAFAEMCVYLHIDNYVKR